MHHHTLLFALCIPLVGCMSAEAQIKQEIQMANHCTTAADCVDVGAKCPFDCYIFVHKDEAARIQTMVEGFESQCVYSCIALSGVECSAGKCMPITDMPAAR